MAKTLNEAQITTANARSKLGDGEYPRRLDADAAVWYRKGKRGGVWFARWRNWGPGANYKQAPLGPANDLNDKPAEGLFTFPQADARARQIVAQARQEAKAAADGPVLKVRPVVEAYIADRDARDSRRKDREVRSDAGQRLRRYVLGQDKRGKQEAIPGAPLADVALHALKESDLLSWRADLPEAMKATTKQRLINDLKAALNGAFVAHRDRLEPTLPAIIKHGLKATKGDDDEAVSVARDNQILTDAQVGALLAAARDIDSEQLW
ncbi:MAG: integrase, partial [Mesorhizobium sp.]